jgi:hypothetical protein
MSTGLPRLRMAIVKLNKLQRMSENMSQLLSNETHMPKNLYQTSSENSYSRSKRGTKAKWHAASKDSERFRQRKCSSAGVQQSAAAAERTNAGLGSFSFIAFNLSVSLAR